MGLSSLRRHRGGYADPQSVQREPTRDELVGQLRDERQKVAALEAKLASSDASSLEAVLAEAKTATDALGEEILAERAKVAALEAELAALKASNAEAGDATPAGGGVDDGRQGQAEEGASVGESTDQATGQVQAEGLSTSESASAPQPSTTEPAPRRRR